MSHAWERVNRLLRKILTHDFNELDTLTISLGVLKSHTKSMLDALAGGSWETPHEAHKLIDNMTSNDNELQNEKTQP